jgi:alanyl-tRNA synthetase
VTERLYYTDSYCTHFSARVVEHLTWDDHPAVVLDRTAFYPLSGGQPADRGALGGVVVLDVAVREEDGAVIHVLERALPGVEVEGEVDWSCRFDHMQQHTGQHVLSAAFEQVLDADTVGFHLGAELSTVDINVARMDPAAVTQVEELANQVVWEDRAISVRVVDMSELAALRLRRPPAVKGPVRIVEIAGSSKGSDRSFDVNPCGGTHLARTGEIGLIKVVRLDYRGDETRVEFLCGGRALRDYQVKNAMLNRLTGMLTVGHWELDQAVERLQAEAKQLQQHLRRARRRLLEVEAAELAEAAAVRGPCRVVWRVWEQREPGDLRALAQELVRHPDMVALLVGVGERTHLCFARADGLDLDVASLLREACAQLGGKGGGRPHLAQGSAPATDIPCIEAVLVNLLPSLELHSR